MIRIHFSRLMGERKEKIADVLRTTGLARNTLAGLYGETTTRLDIATLNAICQHFGCGIGELLEYIPDEAPKAVEPPAENAPVKGASRKA